MSTFRVWLFRGLVIIAVGLVLVSWLLPWWSCRILEFSPEDAVIIRPYALDIQQLGGWADWIKGAQMPVWFTPLMWLVFVPSIVALLISAWVTDRSISLFGRKFNLSKLIIGFFGLAYIGGVVLAAIVITMRLGAFFRGIVPLQGHVYITENYGVPLPLHVDSSLRVGYWLACGAGLLCIALALLRDRIIGKPKIKA